MSQTPQKDGNGAGTPPKRKPLREKTITVTLSLPKAIFSVILLLFILVWAFIFGIMLGKGHNPEELVPELARVMPAPASKTESLPDESMDNVLRPQDLKYHESLKGKDAGSPPRVTPPSAQRNEQPAKPETRQTPKPETTQKNVAQTVQPKPAQQNAHAPQDEQDQTVYNYVYQVAASTNKVSSENLQKKLQIDGLSARISENETNGVTWYRILVSFKGKPDDTRVLRAKLAQHGIPAIILRGKTPAK